jgi:hypothetical protein
MTKYDNLHVEAPLEKLQELHRLQQQIAELKRLRDLNSTPEQIAADDAELEAQLKAEGLL